MAGTILVKDAVWRVSSLLQDVSPQFTRWPELEIINWLNDAHLAITKFMPAACSRIISLKLRPGTLQSIELVPSTDYKLDDGTTPTAPLLGTMVLDVFGNMGSDGLVPGNSIRLLADGREVFDSQKPSWHTIAGTVISNFIFDPRIPKHLMVSPGAHPTTPVWIRMALIAQPTPIPNTGTAGAELYLVGGSSTVKISLSDENIDDIVNYVVARAHMKGAQFGNDNKAALFTSLFTGSINSRVTALTGNNPGLQRLPFAPEPIGQAS